MLPFGRVYHPMMVHLVQETEKLLDIIRGFNNDAITTSEEKRLVSLPLLVGRKSPSVHTVNYC